MKRVLPLLLAVVLPLSAALACSGPVPGTPTGSEAPPTSQVVPTTGVPSETMVPPSETVAPPSETTVPPPEPLVVTHIEGFFNLYALDGSLRAQWAASGLSWARPGVVQVVGDAIYYVKSSGEGLGGVVTRVTAAGSEDLPFTAVENPSQLTFAVSPDQTRIAWAIVRWEGTGPISELRIADINGANAQMIVQSSPDDGIEESYVLEAVRWMPDGTLIYAWQISGIGGYILFYGYSSLYRYDPATGASTSVVGLPESRPGAPCWDAISPDGLYVAGACSFGAEGRLMVEREISTGAESVLPVWPVDQGQAGAAAYSPSGEGFAYAIARGNIDDERGRLIAIPRRGAVPRQVALVDFGYIESAFWADEERVVFGYWEWNVGHVDVVRVADTARAAVGDGQLVGPMWP
jgi:hypothetical protein